MNLAHDPYANVVKTCENCGLWDAQYTAVIPTGLMGLLGPEVTHACLCRAGTDGPEVDADPLLAEVHTGLAMVFTASTARCDNWKPDAYVQREVEEAEEEYERSLAWHQQRGLYPGVNCPPL